MSLKIVGLSEKGKFRKSNQDFIDYLEKKDGSLMAIVCDGMGGHAYGDVASKMAVELFLSEFKKINLTTLDDREINKWMRSSINLILAKMTEHSKMYPNTLDMGTTLVSVIYVNNKAFVINIGDSRVYIVNRNKIYQITKDQNKMNDIKNNEENKKEAKWFLDNKFNEMTYWKALTSALGPTKTLKVDTYVIREPRGKFLLCTDGIHDYLDESTIKDLINQKKKITKKAKDLVQRALENLSTDNLSLIIFEIEGK